MKFFYEKFKLVKGCYFISRWKYKVVYSNLFAKCGNYKIYFILSCVFAALFIETSDFQSQILFLLQFISTGLPIVFIITYLYVSIRLFLIKSDDFKKNKPKSNKMIIILYYGSSSFRILFCFALCTQFIYSILPFVFYPCIQNLIYIPTTMLDISIVSVIVIFAYDLTINLMTTINAVKLLNVGKF